jgi:hypothetical protein
LADSLATPDNSEAKNYRNGSMGDVLIEPFVFALLGSGA